MLNFGVDKYQYDEDGNVIQAEMFVYFGFAVPKRMENIVTIRREDMDIW